MSDMSERLPSTGRRPAMGPDQIQSLLEAYYGEGSPSLVQLCERFHTTNKAGESRPLSVATVRKYLKAAGIELPRGKAAFKECNEGRVAPCSVRTMMNRIPTKMLIGDGRFQLLERLLERGEVSQKALAEQFGISERRVRAVRATVVPVEESAEEAVEAEAAAEEVEETDEVNVLDLAEETEAEESEEA